MMMTRAIPAWNDWWFYFNFGRYLVALAELVLSRSRHLDFVFLTWAIAINLAAGAELLPGSQWGHQIGLALSTPQQTAKPQ